MAQNHRSICGPATWSRWGSAASAPSATRSSRRNSPRRRPRRGVRRFGTSTLQRIHDHLEPGGHSIIPLYVPPSSPEAKNATDEWRVREQVRPTDGAILRVSERFYLDLTRRLRVARLRYEVIKDGATIQEIERPWLLRWHSQQEFRGLLDRIGFEITAVVRDDGTPANAAATAFTFVARRVIGP